jgi:type VI secretion system protein ImpK
MRPEIASLFHCIVGQGLFLKERLRAMPQEDLNFLTEEHAALHGLLLMTHQAQSFRDYTGDPAAPAAHALLAAAAPYPPDQFLGIRYGLACWLDEIIIEISPWVKEWWENSKLETKMYPPLNVRERKFWEQAALAEGRPDIDALEGYYLCVMLGFRGIYQRKPRDLQAWLQKVQPRLLTALKRPWSGKPTPVPVQPQTMPLTGYKAYNRMLGATLVLAAGVILAGTFAVFNYVINHFLRS